jgi:hypothetical protein
VDDPKRDPLADGPPVFGRRRLSLAFFADQMLKRIDLPDGAVVTI